MHLPQVVMVSRLRNTIMNIDKQADVADLITCQRSIAVLLLQYKLSLSNTFFLYISAVSIHVLYHLDKPRLGYFSYSHKCY